MISENPRLPFSADLHEKVLEKQETLHRIILDCEPKNDSLLTGRLGLVLYFFTRYEAYGNEADKQLGERHLQTVIANLNGNTTTLSNASFSAGIGGLLYLLKYLSDRNYCPFDPLEYEEYEDYLFSHAVDFADVEFNDYLHGLFGIVHYFESRLPHPEADQKLERLVSLLMVKANREKESFWIRNFLINEEEKYEINFSLSHGQTGFLMILLRLMRRGINPDVTRQAVQHGINHLLSYKQDIDYTFNLYSFFPVLINTRNNEIKYSNRLAWCYGDLNHLLLLYHAAKAFDDDHYRRMADIIGSTTVNRLSEAATQCFDAHFCHGASGVAQTYKMLFELSGHAYYRSAYHGWLTKTLEMLEADLKANLYKEKECSLLDGLAGISLVLTSFSSPKPLAWSDCLLC